MTEWPKLDELDPDLVARYDKRGPRYTSYPTAPQFTTTVDRAALTARIRATSTAAEPLPVSIYAHVPYCVRKCLYCGCHSEAIRADDEPTRYLEILLDEGALWGGLLGSDRRSAQLSLGGGSPATLGAEGLGRLVRALDGWFPPLQDAERSIELDPYRTDEDLLAALLELGFTRISFGVQDFEPDVLDKVGRHEDPSVVAERLAFLRGRGFEAVSFDLMVGLPGQTLATQERTLRRVIELGPSRLAIFPYAHVPWIKPHQKALERWPLPDADDRLRFYAQAHRLLGEAGYVPVGIDHFARPDDELVRAAARQGLHRNFMGYTTRPGLDQIALGVSAIADIGAAYAQNVKDVDAYRAAVERGELALERGLLLDREDEARRAVIMSLLCNFSVSLAEQATRFGLDWRETFGDDLPRLEPLVADGLLTRDVSGGELRVTTIGRAFVRLVCMIFDQYLERAQAQAEKYSRTL